MDWVPYHFGGMKKCMGRLRATGILYECLGTNKMFQTKDSGIFYTTVSGLGQWWNSEEQWTMWFLVWVLYCFLLPTCTVVGSVCFIRLTLLLLYHLFIISFWLASTYSALATRCIDTVLFLQSPDSTTWWKHTQISTVPLPSEKYFQTTVII